MRKKRIFIGLAVAFNVLIGYAQPTNIDFSAGNISGWTFEQGANYDSYAMTISGLTASNQYSIMTAGSTEINSVPVTMTSPLGGHFLRIGHTGTGGFSYVLSRTFVVPSVNPALALSYAQVLDDGHHPCNEQAYFNYLLKDSLGNIISNAHYTPNGTGCSGGDPSFSVVSTPMEHSYKDWVTQSFSLQNYIGTHVTLEVIASGCLIGQGAHPGYAYVDAMMCSGSFSPTIMSVNTSTYSLLNSQNTISGCGTTTANIVAPPGATSYSWTGTGITGSTSQSVTVTQAGIYQLVFDLPSGCSNTTSVTINVGASPTLAITGPTDSVCANTGVQLIANGANSYAWTPYSASSSGNNKYKNTVYPTATTVYTVTGTTVNGCTGTAQYTITVIPSPSLALTGNTLICPGTPTAFSVTGADTYLWSNGVTTNTIVVSPTVNTNYNVTGHITSTGCAQTLAFSTKMDGVMSYSPGVLRICIGDSLTLTSGGATSYTWNTGATTNTINVKPTTTTNYTVNGTTACGIKQSVLTVTVNPLPNIPIAQFTSPICGGAPATFTTTAGLQTYSWSTGATAYNTVFTPSVSLTSYTNSISVRAMTAVGCVNTNTVTYTVNPVPIINTSLSSGICMGDTSLLVASGASTYTWNPGSILSSSIVVSHSASATYSVVGASSVGCKSTQSISIGVSASSSLTPTANPSITCSGKTTTLTVSGNGSMRWYKSDTTSQYLSSNLTYITPTLSVGTYTYYVSSTCSGHSVRVPVTFTVSANPAIVVSPTSHSVCPSTTFQIVANGANTYTWTSGSPSYVNQVNDTMTTSIPAGYPTVYYTVNGKDLNGCVGTNTVMVKLFPTQYALTITATPSMACVGSTSTLSLIGATSYTWHNGVTSSSTAVTATTGVSYSVNLINMYGCQQTNFVNLFVSQRPTINVSYSGSVSNTTLCAGSTQTLFASGAATYTWNAGPTTSSISVSPTVTTTYTVTGEAANIPGCSTTAVKTITVYAQPNTQITALKDTLCKGSVLTMTATGANTYTWNNGSTSNVYSVSSFTTPASFTVTGINGFGCKKTAVKNIEVFAISQVTAVATPTTLCAGQSLTLSALGVSSYTYSGYSPSYPLVIKAFYNPSDYYVTGKDLHGCISSGSVSVSVDQSAYFSISATPTVCAGSVDFNGNAGKIILNYLNPALTHTMYPGGTIMSSTLYLIAPLVNTTYTVIANSATCSWRDSAHVNAIPLPVVSLTTSGTITCASGSTAQAVATATGPVTYLWQGPNATSNNQSATLIVSTPGTFTCMVHNTVTGCFIRPTCVVSGDIVTNISLTPPFSICDGSTATLTASGTPSLYSWGTGGVNGSLGSNGGTITVTPTATTIYTVTGVGSNNCYGSSTVEVTVNNRPSITFVPTGSVCEGSSVSITASGANIYSWSTGDNTASIYVVPAATEVFTVTGTELVNNCSTTQTVSAMIDASCADVWPGDANSDGTANNIDVLELGLHYSQTGASRTLVSNSWQSYFANNWPGTITNGKNVNHSDCNGDGIINNNDTLAIFNNYGLTHAFKPAQTNTINAHISIVPDQPAVLKGMWGTASVYLGDASTPAIDINGVAFTLDFDNTLIEPANIYIEYQNSFIDASQNVYFRKQDFSSNKIYTATTHTISNNVTGYGKIATVHYQILSGLATDEVLNIGISQAYKSEVSGVITPLTTGTGTLLAVGSTVGIKETAMSGNILISPNPMNGVLNVIFNAVPQNTRIEMYSSIGALVLSETMSNKFNLINTTALSSGIYFIKVIEDQKVVSVKKVVKQ